MNDKVRYWIEISDYDLETAFIEIKSDTAPFSHSLSYLAKKGDFFETFSEEQKDFIDQIEPLNIEARYPSHKERLLKSLTKEKCLEIMKKTKELQLWIKEKL